MRIGALFERRTLNVRRAAARRVVNGDTGEESIEGGRKRGVHFSPLTYSIISALTRKRDYESTDRLGSVCARAGNKRADGKEDDRNVHILIR